MLHNSLETRTSLVWVSKVRMAGGEWRGWEVCRGIRSQTALNLKLPRSWWTIVTRSSLCCQMITLGLQSISGDFLKITTSTNTLRAEVHRYIAVQQTENEALFFRVNGRISTSLLSSCTVAEICNTDTEVLSGVSVTCWLHSYSRLPSLSFLPKWEAISTGNDNWTPFNYLCFPWVYFRFC